MICQKCGKQLNDDFNLCPYCGYRVRQEANMYIDKSQEDQQVGTYNYVNQQIPQNSPYNSGNHAPNANVQKNNKAIGILALIFGIIGLLLSCIYIGIIPAFIAIILGIIGITKKSGKVPSIAGLICGIICILIIASLFGDDTTDNGNTSNTQSQSEVAKDVQSESTTEKEIIESDPEEEISTGKSEEQLREEFIDSCEEFNYKKIARNPDDYVGQNFKVNVKIFSISEKSWIKSAYMKAYTADEDGHYFDNMIYIFDEQDENSEYYVKVLKDDIITVYGTFEEMVESKNMINGETSKEIALHMKYTELISDGE